MAGSGVLPIKAALKRLPWDDFFHRNSALKQAHLSVVSSGPAVVPTPKLTRTIEETLSQSLKLSFVPKGDRDNTSAEIDALDAGTLDKSEVEEGELPDLDKIDLGRVDETKKTRKRSRTRTTAPEENIPTIFVRRINDQIQVSLSATPMMYKRNVGEAKWTVTAPMRETLAAAIITQVRFFYIKKNLNDYRVLLIDCAFKG